jgi:hypothetical protein
MAPNTFRSIVGADGIGARGATTGAAISTFGTSEPAATNPGAAAVGTGATLLTDHSGGRPSVVLGFFGSDMSIFNQ